MDILFKSLLFIVFFGCFSFGSAAADNDVTKINAVYESPSKPNNTVVNVNKGKLPCVCGVFLSGQFDKSSMPKGNAIFRHEHEMNFACNALGNKQCINKCLEMLVKHLVNSPALICGAIDRDCHKERAYLFIKNCNDQWLSTNLSAGREFCCKNGEPYKCPLM